MLAILCPFAAPPSCELVICSGFLSEGLLRLGLARFCLPNLIMASLAFGLIVGLWSSKRPEKMEAVSAFPPTASVLTL
jgi:hypothetical protein